jgi:CarboxypepD_reg-like domain/Gram-negative bacterial TonB protein C-terminal
MSAKKKHRSASEYLQYLKGELSNKERHSFERKLEADSFEKEALEGLETLSPQEAEEDLLLLHDKVRRRLKRRRRIAIYSIAASVASILIVGSIFLNIYQLNPDQSKEPHSGDEIFMQDKPETLTKAEEELIPEKEVTVAQAEERVTAKPDSKVTQSAGKPAQAQEPELDELILVEAEPQMEAEPQKSRKKDRSERKGNAAPAPATRVSEKVSGVVLSSEDMEPLPGASLAIKGSDQGMVTDMEGRFSLVTDKESQPTIIASYVGMETTEYQLKEGENNQVVMQPDISSLDEIVVVGYGVQKEANPTGAVQSIEYKEENDFQIYSGAKPEGGLDAYKIYMEEHIHFPERDSTSKREVVVLKFNVEADGTISGITTLRSPGEQFTEQAIKLIQEGPSWKPARDENGNTDDVVRMRIVFKR